MRSGNIIEAQWVFQENIPALLEMGSAIWYKSQLEKFESFLRKLLIFQDYNGLASKETQFNPNGSVCAIEGILSPDGRVFGKMGHSERYDIDLCSNIPGPKDQKLFESGVKYFL